MARTRGSKDSKPRTRRTATAAEQQKREKACEAAKTKKWAAGQAKAAAAKTQFVEGLGGVQRRGARSESEDADVEECASGTHRNDPPGRQERNHTRSDGEAGHHHDADTDDGQHRGQPASRAEARREARPADIEAELDYDEQIDASEDAVSIMGTYLKAVFDRLHSETTGDASRNALEAKWLLELFCIVWYSCILYIAL